MEFDFEEEYRKLREKAAAKGFYVDIVVCYNGKFELYKRSYSVVRFEEVTTLVESFKIVDKMIEDEN